jgi:RNase P subunit RPR2
VADLKESLCEKCGAPLFLTKEECRDFVEDKMKQGYLVCRCCGAKKTTKQDENENSNRKD